MTVFLALAALMGLGAAAIVLLGARGRRGEGGSRPEANVAILRHLLGELELEHARGTIGAAEFAQARDELLRRLLLDTQPHEAQARSRPSRWPVFAAAASVPLLAAWLYAAVGNPSSLQAGDAPAAPVAAAGMPEHELRARLEAHVASSPNDARAWVLLARLRMDADQFGPAAAAYSRAIEKSRKVAADPQVWAEYADALGMSQGGRLAGKPREAIDRALGLDPAHPKALDLAGSAAYEVRDFRSAHAYWAALLARLPEGSPQRPPLIAAVEKTERLARLSPPVKPAN